MFKTTTTKVLKTLQAQVLTAYIPTVNSIIYCIIRTLVPQSTTGQGHQAAQTVLTFINFNDTHLIINKTVYFCEKRGARLQWPKCRMDAYQKAAVCRNIVGMIVDPFGEATFWTQYSL